MGHDAGLHPLDFARATRASESHVCLTFIWLIFVCFPLLVLKGIDLTTGNMIIFSRRLKQMEASRERPKCP